MAVKIRLRRMGRKKRPFYRVVAADSRAPRDGRFIEKVGTYDPLVVPYEINFDEERVFYWLGNGAQPTRTVRNLLEKKGLWLKWDLMKKGVDEQKIAEEFAKFTAMQEERAKRLAEKQAQSAVKKAKVEETEAVEEKEAADENKEEQETAE